MLHNKFSYADNKNIYVECISEDIGGYVRVKEYMNKMQFSGAGGLLICIVSDDKDSIEIAKNLWSNSNYAAADHNLVSPKLLVSFIRVSDMNNLDICPFEFDRDGNEIKFLYTEYFA